MANRGFHNGNNHTPGWFGNGDDDMRYFPVNRIGIDLELKVPCPVESFPLGISNYGGIDFKLINPDRNYGKSCLIATAGTRNKIKFDGKIAKIWMLGAASENYSTGTIICDATLNYTDGSSSNAKISAGVHLNGYQSSTAVSRGIPAWTGITPKWKNAVLWCWNIENKYPQKKVTSIVLNNRKKWDLIAMTVEK